MIGKIYSTIANELQFLANSGILATASDLTSGSLSYKSVT